MKNLFIFLFLILLLQNSNAQTPQIFHKEESRIGFPDDFGKKNNSEKTSPKTRLKDTIENVILINKENIAIDGNNFLIDIPIKAEKNLIAIFVNDERISAELFFDRKSFLPGQNEILLITPDWAYEKSFSEFNKKLGEKGGCAEPIRQNKFYHIQRNNNKIDSVIVRMDDPRKPITLNFKKPEFKQNEKQFCYSDCYGSVCCPRDDKWDTYEGIQNKIKDFEKEHNLIISKSSNNFGEEGEHCTSYNLNGLTTEQKFLFIKEFKSETKEQFPQIYLPSIIE